MLNREQAAYSPDKGESEVSTYKVVYSNQKIKKISGFF
jgi:hypothetical protein